MKIRFTINVPEWVDRIFAWPVMLYRQWKYGYPFRRIPLTEGKFTIVDPRDFCRFNKFDWFASGDKELIYAVRNVITASGRTTIARLHREIMNASPGLLVDHRNNDTLDNRRANLRLATRSQNSCNSRRNKSKTSSQFRGVFLERVSGRWMVKIGSEGKRIWLGRFDSEIEAAKAYDEAARKYHGEFAKLNFPERGVSPLSA